MQYSVCGTWNLFHLNPLTERVNSTYNGSSHHQHYDEDSRPRLCLAACPWWRLMIVSQIESLPNFVKRSGDVEVTLLCAVVSSRIRFGRPLSSCPADYILSLTGLGKFLSSYGMRTQYCIPECPGCSPPVLRILGQSSHHYPLKLNRYSPIIQ